MKIARVLAGPLLFVALGTLIGSCAPTEGAVSRADLGVWIAGEDVATALEVQDDALVFASTEADRIGDGDIVSSGIAPGAPYGYLRRVVARGDAEGGRVRLVTEAATLADLPPEILESGSSATANGLTARADFIEVRTRVTSGALFADVRMRVRPEIELTWEHDGGIRPRRVAAIARIEVRDLDFSGRIGVLARARLLRFELPPLQVFVGVPLVLRNQLTVSVETRGFVEGALDGGIVLERATVVAGVEWRREGGWTVHREADIGPLRVIAPGAIERSYAGQLDLPVIAVESSPYGRTAFRFFAGGRLVNEVRYSPSEALPLRVQTTPRLEAGMKAQFFGVIDEETAWRHELDPFVAFEGTLSGALTRAPGSGASTPPGRFASIRDVPADHWAAGEIRAMVDRFFAGYPDGTFRPDATVTRAELAAMIVATLDPAPRTSVPARSFSDVRGHWAERAISQLARAGWVSGFPDGTYRPDRPVSRVEATVMVAAGLGVPEVSASRLGDWLLDADRVPSWARAALASAIAATLVVCHPDRSRFAPDANATRADVTVLLYRALLWRDGMPDPVDNPFLIEP